MEYVIVRREPHGYWFDPQPYLEILPSLSERLPAGAKEYALDPAHYDFYSDRCVKDLWLRSVAIDDMAKSVGLTFAPNEFKHSDGLSLTYTAVATVAVELTTDPQLDRIGSLLLDELLPVSKGVAHELLLTTGSIRVVAQDVSATWG